MALYENGKYHDPLHVPTGNLIVFYEGKPVLMLNKALLDQQNCWTNLEAIKEVHWFKHMLFDLIENTNDSVELKELAKDLTECEFELQRLYRLALGTLLIWILAVAKSGSLVSVPARMLKKPETDVPTVSPEPAIRFGLSNSKSVELPTFGWLFRFTSA